LLSTLAIVRYARYELSDDERDLDTSILLSTLGILLPSFPSTVIKNVPNPITTFYYLTVAFFHRSLKASRPNDVEYCVRHLRYLRGQSLGDFGVPRDEVTTLLVQALAFQLHSKLGNGTQGIEEVSALCHELLASGLSETKLIVPMESFAGVVAVDAMRSWRQPSQQVMDCLREAHTRLPNSHDILYALSTSHHPRFLVTKSIHDYKRAMAPLDKIIASYSQADTPSNVGRALHLAANLARARFIFYGNPEYLEEAIFLAYVLISVHSHLKIRSVVPSCVP
jgi:hypothetical protein